MIKEIQSSYTFDGRIFIIRGHRVMLDSDLAKIYGVPTFRFNEAIKRNKNRFPSDFMFQLTKEEFVFLKSQIAISKVGRGGRRTLPYVFTDYGSIMAANVLRSEKAIEMSLYVVRAFARLRETAIHSKELALKLKELEQKFGKHDEEIQLLFNVIKKLMVPPPEETKKRIGFRP